MNELLDPYDRPARFYPMVIVLLPLALAIGSWVPTAPDLAALVGSTVTSLALAAFLTQLARDQGKKKEPDLFRMWGGKPSASALSYAGGVFPAETLARCHRKLAEMDSNLSLPASAEAEASQMEEAISAYESANDMLLQRTRDRKRFRLVFRENVNYGFRRNLWGMKPTGIASAIVGLVAGSARVVQLGLADEEVQMTAITAALVSLVMLAVWLLLIRPSWVKVAADSFARQLVGACETL